MPGGSALTELNGDDVGLELRPKSQGHDALALVPGLLQTPERHHVRLCALAVRHCLLSIVEERVQARVIRQRLLAAAAGPRFVAVLDESVLHRVVGSPSVMVAQLRQILEMSRLPNITIPHSPLSLRGDMALSRQQVHHPALRIGGHPGHRTH